VPQSLQSLARARQSRALPYGAAILATVAACTDPTSSVAPHKVVPADPMAAGVLIVAPNGVETAQGTAHHPLSFEKAVASAHGGMVIQLLSGTYRTGTLTITQPVTIQPAPGATVTLSGSVVVPASQWQPAGRGWRTPWREQAAPSSSSAIAEAALSQSSAVGAPSRPGLSHESGHMAFLDGKPLTAAASPNDIGPGMFFVDTVGKWLYVSDNPASHTIEASTHATGLTVQASNARVTGVRFEHYSQAGLRIQGSNVRVDHSNFSHNGLIGLDVNGGWNVLADNNYIAYNGQVGAVVSHSTSVTFANNNISHNNTRHFNVSWEAAGIKVTSTRNFDFHDNWVQGNASNAVWVDVGSTNTTIARNTVLESQCYGIYFELANGALIVGNVVHNNTSGIGVHFSANARIYNNTLVNNGTNLDVSASYRRSPYDLSHAVIVNNLLSSASRMMANLYRYNGCNSWVYSAVDYNGYYRPWRSPARTEVNWCNHFYQTMSAFHHGTGREAHGQEYEGGGDPFFVNAWRGDFHLHRGSRAIHRGQPLPSDAARALGVRAWVPVNLGALQN
jgi:parallel beta-helix repeat protein